jgi:hypothetical protein
MKKQMTALAVRIASTLMLVAVSLLLCWPNAMHAQGDGARFYWKGLNKTNAVPVIGSSIGGNVNPLDPSLRVLPKADIQATMASAGYARMLPFLKRSAMLSVLVPMGRISSDLTINGRRDLNTARGFGDPLAQFTVNVVGRKAIMNIPDMLRYKPGFSVDLLASLAVPIGEYDNESPLNIGQNRWYGRIGAPIVWQLGPWVPGERTTLEFLPAIWLFGDNTEFDTSKTLETKPLFQLEGHLTRDFTEGLWGSLDVVYYSGGAATIDGGEEADALNNFGVGGTLGYHLNDNMTVNLSYSSTVNDNADDDLKMDGFRMTLVYGWHNLVEGMKRLKGND